jgi:hypothetical protein
MILESALQQRTETSLADIVELLEAMLCFDAWLNQGTFWRLEETAVAKDSAQFSIKVLMSVSSNYLPTTNSNRWNFPKFHELLHVANYMSRLGAPTNFCTQRPESLLISAAKQPGRRAQKRHHGIDYELQAAQRLSASDIIDTVYERIFDNPSQSSNENVAIQSLTSKITQGTNQATSCTIDLEQSTQPGKITFRACWSSSTKV